MKKRYTFLLKNWFHFGLTSVFFFCVAFNALAQTAPAMQWDKSFGGNGTEYQTALQQTTDGGYILAGQSASTVNVNRTQPSFGNHDFWIIKLDAAGNKLWDKTFGGTGVDEVYSIKQTPDGGFIIGGSSTSSISGNKTQATNGSYDYWLVKTDAAGNKLWDKAFGGTGADNLMALQLTSDGGYIIGGYTLSGNSGDKSQPSRGGYDYWVLKLDAGGNKIWDKTLGGDMDDHLLTLQQVADGGFLLTGYSDSGQNNDKSQPSKGDDDFWIIKLNANGVKLWDKTLGGNSSDVPYASLQLTDGGYLLGGYTNSSISGDKSQHLLGGNDYWLVKIDSVGNKLWDKAYGGGNHDNLKCLQQTTDGNIIIGGLSDSGTSIFKTDPSKGGSDYWVMKIDNSGNILWEKTIGASATDILYSFQQTSDGGFILGGHSQSDSNNDKSQNSWGDYDFWVVKLAPEILGVKDSEVTSSISISPNPNQGKFNLQLNNLTYPKAEITISDLLGRKVLQQEFKTANHQLSEEITLPNAKGIYLLQLKAGDQIVTRKIIVE